MHSALKVAMTGKSSRLSSLRQHSMDKAGARSGTESKNILCGLPVRMPKIITNNLGLQQGHELDVSQNMNIVLLYNRYFTGQKLNIPFI